MTPLEDLLKYRAGYSRPEIESILAQPELQNKEVQAELVTVLSERGSPANLRRAFETQVALHVKPVPAEAATDAPSDPVVPPADPVDPVDPPADPE